MLVYRPVFPQEYIEEEDDYDDDPEALYPPRPSRSYRLQELLLKSGHEEAAQVVHEAIVTGLQDDPTRVQPGDLFFVYGATPDVRSAAAAVAVERGACALLTEAPLEEAVGNVPCAVVENLGMAAQRIAVAFYDDPSTRVTTVGFVGSAGKTTTAWLVRGIFEQVQQVCCCGGGGGWWGLKEFFVVSVISTTYLLIATLD